MRMRQYNVIRFVKPPVELGNDPAKPYMLNDLLVQSESRMGKTNKNEEEEELEEEEEQQQKE